MSEINDLAPKMPDWLTEKRKEGTPTLNERVAQLPEEVLAAGSKIRHGYKTNPEEEELLRNSGIDPDALRELVSGWGVEEGPPTAAYLGKVLGMKSKENTSPRVIPENSH